MGVFRSSKATRRKTSPAAFLGLKPDKALLADRMVEGLELVGRMHCDTLNLSLGSALQ
jgi:hypothetical protein